MDRITRISHLTSRCLSVVLAGALALAGCGGGGGDDDVAVNPSDPNATMNSLLFKVGGSAATLISGSPPAPTAAAAAPKVEVGTGEVITTVTSGSVVSLPLSFQAGSVMEAIFAKIGGASTYFQIDNPPGGKSMKAVPDSGNGQGFIISLELARDFTPGEICLQISGRDADEQVSNVAEVCAQLVATLPTPTEDQPEPAELLTSLEGTWISPCQPFQTESMTGSAKIGFDFDGVAYSQFLEAWSTDACTGNPTSVGTVVTGSVQAGAAPVFLDDSGTWALPFDFIPDQASSELGADLCFNALRFTAGTTSEEDSFALGLPIGFTEDGQDATPGSCVSVETRPTFLSADVPFARGSILPLNQLPVADAGPNQSVETGAAVQLTGAQSDDADGTIAGFSWAQTGGTPTVTLSNASTATPNFTAPDSVATLTFTLTVTDDSGGVDTDEVQVAVGGNASPDADAGPDVTKGSQSAVQLDGSASSDSDGTIASYSWDQTDGIAVTLNGATTATPSFTAPNVASGTILLTFELTVTDDDGNTDTDTVVVTIAKNAPPVANAGPNQSVKTATATVTLDGTASNDPDVGSVITYAWTQTGGTAVSLTGANTASPTFAAPTVNTGSVVLTFQLVVTDNFGAVSAADSVNVTVNAKQAPISNAGPNFLVVAGANDVALDGTGSSDPDGSVVGFSWSQTAGSPVTLVGANTATPEFDATVPAGQALVFRLRVTDDDGLIDDDNVQVSVVAPLDISYQGFSYDDGSGLWAFEISSNQPVANWFVGPNAIFPGAYPGQCSGGPQGQAQITCTFGFVATYLGEQVGGCTAEGTAKLNAAATLLRFDVMCLDNLDGTVVTAGDVVGIGQNASTPPAAQARSASTGDLEPVNGTCVAQVQGPAACD